MVFLSEKNSNIATFFQDNYVVNKGDRIAQGIFMNYLLTDDDDLAIKSERKYKNDYYFKE